MNAKMTAKSLVTALLLAVGSASFAEEVFLGRLEEVEETVPSGTETSSDSYFVDSESGWFSKLGAGGLVFPLSNVLSPVPLKIALRNGSLRLTDESASVAAKPTIADAPAVIREKAAFWVDSRTNLAYADEPTGTVAHWYDVRETAADIAAGTTKYVSAHAVKLYAENIVYPKLSEDAEDGNKYINFNGIHASTAMKFANAGGSDPNGKVTGVKHIFTSHRMTTGCGMLWGVNANLSPDWLPSFLFGDYKGDFADQYLGLNKNYYADYRGYDGRFWRDGVLFDPCNTKADARTEVLEFAAARMQSVEIDNFFCDRAYATSSYGYRCGGDDIGECIVFAVALTESERLQVSRYLLARWRQGLNPGGVSISASGTSAVEITDSADGLTVDGETVIRKVGSETATLQRLYGTGLKGAVRLEDGTLVYEAGELRSVLAEGEKISAEKDKWDVQTVSKTAAESGTVEVSGDASVVLPDIPDGTERLVVSGGRVALGGKKLEGAIQGGDSVYATIPNGGFEEGSLVDSGWVVTTDGATVSINDYKTGSNYQFPYRDATDLVHYGAPEGTKVLMLRQKRFFVHGKIVFPVAGVYDFSLFAAPRSDWKYAASTTDILLFREGETNVVARLKTRYENNGYTKYSFRLPRVEAGEYRIGFRNESTSANEQNVFVDDLKARLVLDADEKEVSIPAGDFERETYPDNKDLNLFTLSTSYGVTGWTLDNSGFGVSASTPDVAVISSRTSTGVYRESMRGAGDRQLLFTGTSGAATSDSFAVPAGTYSLRFDATRVTRGSFKVSSVSYLPYGVPNFEVAVFKNGGADPVATYASGALSSFLVKTVETPSVTFAVAKGDVISVRIRQTATGSTWGSYTCVSCGVIDNVRLVGSGVGGNLVKNPTFAWNPVAGSDWTLDNCNDANNVNAIVYRAGMPRGAHYGYAVCDDASAVLFCQCAAIHQEINVPESGWYKFSCWTVSRAEYEYDSIDLTHKYGGNQLKVWWCKEDGTDTNEFYRSACIFSTNFLEQTAYVKLPKGKVRLGLQGVNRNGVEVVAPNKTDSSFFVDCVSLKAVEAPTAPTELTGKTVTVAKGAKLRLDFEGQVTLESFGYGKGHRSGIINAERFPEFISGEGSFYVEPKGLLLIVK